MKDAPSWYPLSVDAVSRVIVRDAQNNIFAVTPSIDEAALIVLVMNSAARRDFGDGRP